jgi:hypothetical protein
VINRAKLNAFIMLHCIINANLLLNYKYIDMHRVEFLVETKELFCISDGFSSIKEIRV